MHEKGAEKGEKRGMGRGGGWAEGDRRVCMERGEDGQVERWKDGLGMVNKEREKRGITGRRMG